MDLVINHTSSRHDWFKTAREYIKGLKKEKNLIILYVLKLNIIILTKKAEMVILRYPETADGITKASSRAACRILILIVQHSGLRLKNS